MAKIYMENKQDIYVLMRKLKEATVTGMYGRIFDGEKKKIYLETEEYGTLSQDLGMSRYDKAGNEVDYLAMDVVIDAWQKHSVEDAKLMQQVGWRARNVKALVDTFVSEGIVTNVTEAFNKADVTATVTGDIFEETLAKAKEEVGIKPIKLEKPFKVYVNSYVMDGDNEVEYYASFYDWGIPYPNDKELNKFRFAASVTGYYGTFQDIQTELLTALRKGGVK